METQYTKIRPVTLQHPLPALMEQGVGQLLTLWYRSLASAESLYRARKYFPSQKFGIKRKPESLLAFLDQVINHYPA